MKTLELIRTDTDPPETIYEEEVADEEYGDRLKAYRLRADVLNLGEGAYEARVRPEATEEPVE